MTHESLHALEVRILTLIGDYPYTGLPNQVSFPDAILQVDKGGIVDHQPCSTNDVNSPKVNEVKRHTRG